MVKMDHQTSVLVQNIWSCCLNHIVIRTSQQAKHLELLLQSTSFTISNFNTSSTTFMSKRVDTYHPQELWNCIQAKVWSKRVISDFQEVASTWRKTFKLMTSLKQRIGVGRFSNISSFWFWPELNMPLVAVYKYIGLFINFSQHRLISVTCYLTLINLNQLQSPESVTFCCKNKFFAIHQMCVFTSLTSFSRKKLRQQKQVFRWTVI